VHPVDDATLARQLDAALVRCREAIADYRAGLLDEDDLRRTLRRDGVVRCGRETWQLDLEAEHWHRWVRDADDAAVEEVGS
jgi:hypothetical protein